MCMAGGVQTAGIFFARRPIFSPAQSQANEKNGSWGGRWVPFSSEGKVGGGAGRWVCCAWSKRSARACRLRAGLSMPRFTAVEGRAGSAAYTEERVGRLFHLRRKGATSLKGEGGGGLLAAGLSRPGASRRLRRGVAGCGAVPPKVSRRLRRGGCCRGRRRARRLRKGVCWLRTCRCWRRVGVILVAAQRLDLFIYLDGSTARKRRLNRRLQRRANGRSQRQATWRSSRWTLQMGAARSAGYSGEIRRRFHGS